jgi:hypothetical protein
VFYLGQERFALPIQFAYRVVPMMQLLAPFDSSTPLFYQGRELLVLNAEHQIFHTPPSQRLLTASPEKKPYRMGSDRQGCLLILQTDQQDLIALPLASQPFLLQVAETAFAPVPSAYLAESNVRCASALVIPNPNDPPIFLLDLNRLVQPQVSESPMQVSQVEES